MRKRKKFCITLFFSLALMLSLSVSALAVSPRAIVYSLRGATQPASVPGWSYSAYNTIVITNSGAYARVNASCSPACGVGEIGAVATMRYPIYNTPARQSSIVYNENAGCTGIVVSTPQHTAPDSYYADSHVYMKAGGANTGFNVPRTEPLQYPYNGSKTFETSVLGTNENGHIFGYMTESITDSNCPDLVRVVGVDGTLGYVYAIEAFNEVKPMSALEASALMTNRDYIQGRLVNLYASDGSTIIGQYLAGGLIGVTVQELGEDGEIMMTRTYNEDGTIVTIYADGTKNIIRWK